MVTRRNRLGEYVEERGGRGNPYMGRTSCFVVVVQSKLVSSLCMFMSYEGITPSGKIR